MSEALPARPDLEWYRKSAKRKLEEMRARDPGARLAGAQLAVAREAGFSSWRKLKARIEELAIELPRLYDAIRRNDRAVIAMMLTNNPDLARATDAAGNSAVHVAAESNNPHAIAMLMARNANAQASFSGSGHTALSWALTMRAFESARALVRGGIEPDLFCSAGLGDVQRVKSFFNGSGALQPNASHTGSSRYAADGSRLKCPPETDREVISDALYMACRNGHVGIVRELLKHDVDLSFRAFIGGTPLHWAYFGGEREIVELLLARGVDTTVRDSVFNCTPRSFGVCVACNWGVLSIVKKALQCEPQALNVLDGRGAPLHEAARAGHVPVVQFLLTAGAHRSMRDSHGKTALELAREKNQNDVIGLLS